MDTEQLINNDIEGEEEESHITNSEILSTQVIDKTIYRITIEPVLCAIFLAQCLSDAVLTEFYLKRTCEVQLRLNDSFCDALGTNTPAGHRVEAVVQPHAAVLLMWKMVLQSVVPAILSLFLGPWSDIHGRKPVMLSSVAGCTLMYATYAGLVFLPHLHPGYILMGIVPLSLLGGYVNLISASYCFITDVSNADARSLRLAILEGFLFAGLLIGMSSSSYVFNAAEAYGFGFLAIFGLAGIICFLALVYMVFLVPESVHVTQEPEGIRGIFNISLPKEMARTCFRRREGGRRAVVFLCMVTLATCILTLEGESQVAFLFTRLQFGWSLTKFTVFSSVFMLVTIIGTLVGCWLLPKYLHVTDTYLSLFAFSTDIIQCVLAAVAAPTQSYLMYVGGTIGLFRGVVAPVIRSVMSKTVPREDLGKVFALTSSLESVMPIAASPLYVFIYDATLHVIPGAFFLLSAGFYALDVICLGTIIVIQKKSNHSNLDPEPTAISE